MAVLPLARDQAPAAFRVIDPLRRVIRVARQPRSDWFPGLQAAAISRKYVVDTVLRPTDQIEIARNHVVKLVAGTVLITDHRAAWPACPRRFICNAPASQWS